MIGLVGGGLVILLAGGYAIACAISPVPAPTLALGAEVSTTFSLDDSDLRAAVDGESAPTAIGWLDDDAVWENTIEAAPIASISKLVTALVTLERAPLDGDGAVHVWSAADAARQQQYLDADGVAFPIAVGTEITARQMLELALIPSANDYAAAFAYSVFGDNDAFLAAVHDWQDRQGITSLSLFEPTGMDERNAASPGDVLRIARLALADPTIAAIVSQPYATPMAEIGEVTSTNPLFGVLDGVVGVKTGRTDVAGYNLAAARTSDAAGREVTQISVVLGRETAQDRLTSSLSMFSALDAAPSTVTLVAAGEEFGTLTGVDGASVAVIAGAGVTAVLVPGEEGSRRAAGDPAAVAAAARADGDDASDAAATSDAADAADAADARIAAGQRVGTLTVETPVDGGAETDLTTAAPLADPDYLWRLTHPRQLFGLG